MPGGTDLKKKKKKKKIKQTTTPQDMSHWLTRSTDLEIARMSSLLDSVHSHSSENAEGPSLEEEEVTVFVTEPSANLLCPLHSGLFVAPVIARCGHTFCKSCLVRYVDTATQQINECPLDKTVIKHADLANLIPNLVVADAIQGLKIYCKYGCKKYKGRWIRDPDGGCSQVRSSLSCIYAND